MKINLDIVNEVTYKYDFFITEIFVLWSAQNLIKFVDLRIYILGFIRLSFFG
jgi:hypothetical protein